MTQRQREKVQYLAVSVVRNILKVFWIFPIKDNRIACVSHSGKQYSCNPKYLSLYLQKRYPGKFEIIFALREPKRWKGNGVRFVKFLSISNFYYFCTAKVIISNSGMLTYLPKRKKQYIINTWHGGGAYKRGGNLYNEGISKQRMLLDLYKSRCTNLVISSCERFSRVVVPDLLYQYKDEIMPCGLPRNDIICQGDHSLIRKNVCERLNIDPDRKVILYAPTYRGSIDSMSVYAAKEFMMDLDVDSLLDAVRNRFCGEPILLVRAHHAMNIAPHTNSNNIVDVSDYPDTQELLCAGDILISDYSSIIWDFSLTKRPCFQYVPDLDYYMNDDRGTYTPIETWPGIIARSNEELRRVILEFDEESYVKKVDKHHAELGSYENGTACEQVCQRIAEVCKKRL